MNEPRVRAIPEMNGFRGEFRKLDRAGWHSVEANGIPQLFESEDKATIAAYEAMNAHHFGRGILRDGEKVSGARSTAENLFGAIFRRGRKIEVERR